MGKDNKDLQMEIYTKESIKITDSMDLELITGNNTQLLTKVVLRMD
jgi:hypothetical protein